MLRTAMQQVGDHIIPTRTVGGQSVSQSSASHHTTPRTAHGDDCTDAEIVLLRCFVASMLRCFQGLVSESVVSEKATRIVYSLAAVGALDAPPPTGTYPFKTVCLPLRYCLFTPELQWQARGNRLISQGCKPDRKRPTGTVKTNVTSAAHFALARKLAASTAILLRNKGAALPLPPPTAQATTTIALIGAAGFAGRYLY